MNIYIYGNNGFKKEIHQTLEHANIKFKLDDDSIIKDITDLNELKKTIQDNPNDIYLIDDEKIIKKNGLSKKIKFLTPKDGIEEEFLLDNGIADVSVNSLSEIPKYILDKHEQEKSSEIHDSIVDIVDDAYSNEDDYFDEPIELDDELSALLAGENNDTFTKEKDMQEEVINKENELEEFDFDDTLPTFDEDNNDILDDENISLEENFNLDDIDNLLSSSDEDDSSTEISNDDLNSMMNFDEDFGLDNISRDYDDENSVKDENSSEELSEVEKVLENEDIIEEDNMDSFPELEGLDDLDKLIDENKLDDIELDESFSELDSIEDFDMQDAIDSLDESLSNSKETSDTKKEESNKGVIMADEFSELDSLNEADVLSALEGLNDINTSTQQNSPSKVSIEKSGSSSENVEVTASNTQDIADLISKLLNNKTLEITIKIKD